MSRRLVFAVAVSVGLALAAFFGIRTWIERGHSGETDELAALINDESRRLRHTWGPESYAERREDLKVVDFFEGRRGGFFLDVGAYDYKQGSNTYLLEKSYGWSGIAIDALDYLRSGYEAHRPATRFFNFYVADESDAIAEFFVVGGRDMESTGLREAAELKAGFETVEVPQITLDRLLTLEGVESVDFLSLDIELAEPVALRGFDIERFGPALVCIEEHPKVAEELRAYFDRHGYEKIELWSRFNVLNAFYVRGDLVEPFHRRWEQAWAEYEMSSGPPASGVEGGS